MLLMLRSQTLFLLNATVLITHQIDAGYWHEWELFHIPGGNQVNLLLNLPIIALVLYAQGQVAANTKKSAFYYKVVACLGFLTVAIHGTLFITGYEAFIQPVSIALLFATTLLSGLQFIFLRRKVAGQAGALSDLSRR